MQACCACALTNAMASGPCARTQRACACTRRHYNSQATCVRCSCGHDLPKVSDEFNLILRVLFVAAYTELKVASDQSLYIQSLCSNVKLWLQLTARFAAMQRAPPVIEQKIQSSVHDPACTTGARRCTQPSARAYVVHLHHQCFVATAVQFASVRALKQLLCNLHCKQQLVRI